MQITFDFEMTSAIPVDIDDIRRLGVAEWAADAAARFTAAVDTPVELHDRLRSALSSVASEASDDARRFLLVGIDALALAPFVFFVTDGELTRQEQAEFLWSPTAILPPAPLRSETEHLGVGFSSTLAQREDGVDFGTRRWLFFGQGRTAGALLGPVAPYALAVLEPVAERILATARAEGFVALHADDRVTELESAVVRAGDDWKA